MSIQSAKSRLLHKRLKRLGAAFALALASTITLAQNDFAITTSNPDLASQYKVELDKWMLEAYEGDPDAQFKVGVLYTNSQFREPDFEQAVYWYKQAARQGHTLAQYNLGHQYISGQGVAKNETEAMSWWEKAANDDHALAQFNLGRAYYLGIGVQEDHSQSKYWFERAAGNGEPKSEEILRQLGWDDNLASVLAQNKPIDTPAPEPESNLEPFQSRITPLDAPGKTASASQSKPSVSATLDNTSSPASEPASEQLPTQTSAPARDTSSSAPAQTGVSTLLPSTVAKTQPETTIASKPSRNQSENARELMVEQPSAQTADSFVPTTVALFSNPEPRSVLIALENDVTKLTVIKRKEKWTSITHSDGFPVWVHSDDIEVEDSEGTVKGRWVSARSVPIDDRKTKLERFKKNEKLKVIGQRDDWVRVMSPARFSAWVKTDELDAVFDANSINNDSLTEEFVPQSSVGTVAKAPPQNKPKTIERDSSTIQRPRSQTLSSEQERVSNDWLYRQPKGYFTLQLESFSDPENAQKFARSPIFANDDNLHSFTSQRNGINWTYFLYGSFADSASADIAKRKIGYDKAWLRSLDSLKTNNCKYWKSKTPVAREYAAYCR